MKKLTKIIGAKQLSKKGQQAVKGGKADLCRNILCIPEKVCINGKCVDREWFI
jgi:hypothetical protein